MQVKQVIVVRKDLKMRKGKMAAQVGHASQAFILSGMSFDHEEGTGHVSLSKEAIAWAESALTTKIVAWVNSEAELNDLIHRAIEAGIVVHSIIDAGRTEFHGVETLTCAAFGPDYADKLDKVTGHLPLL